MTPEETRYSRVVSFFISASFISTSPTPSIKGCDDVQWHTSSYLTVLLCTHPWMLPWRPRGSEGSVPVCIQMLRVAWRSPSIRRANCKLHQHLSPSLLGSWLSLQSSKKAAAVTERPGVEESWHLVAGFPAQPMTDSASQPGVRLLNPHKGLGFFFLIAVHCPAYRGGIREPPYHSVWFSEGDSSHQMWTWRCPDLSCLDTPSN